MCKTDQQHAVGVRAPCPAAPVRRKPPAVRTGAAASPRTPRLLKAKGNCE